MSKELTDEILLDLVQEGKKAGEIAQEFGLSPQKVGMMIKALTDGVDETPKSEVKSKDVTEANVLELINSGLSVDAIAEGYGTTRQRVELLIKKAEYANAGSSNDEFPAEMFARESNVIRDASMGNSIVLTAKEYNEYSDANGRYQGRKKGQKTRLDPMELRVAITGIQRGDRSASDVRQHLLNKHGITIDELKKVAFQLTKEEEISYSDVLKSLGIR